MLAAASIRSSDIDNAAARAADEGDGKRHNVATLRELMRERAVVDLHGVGGDVSFRKRGDAPAGW